jgi:hypothetical protein
MLDRIFLAVIASALLLLVIALSLALGREPRAERSLRGPGSAPPVLVATLV